MNIASHATQSGFLKEFRTPPMPGLPKYAQLREMLFSAIRAGHWKPGDKLPTETDLTRLTPFSLGTVQRALRALVEEGLVVRTQGSGTFVAQGRAPIDAPLHLRFLGGEGEPHFLPLFPRVLSKKRVTGRGPWSEFLHQRGNEIVRIDRRLSVNGEFQVFSRFYFNAGTFPGVSDRTVAQLDGVNLKELLASAFRMPVTRIAQRISLVKFAPKACRAIGVKLATRGVLLESEASAARDTAVYYLESYIPPNGRRFDVSPD